MKRSPRLLKKSYRNHKKFATKAASGGIDSPWGCLLPQKIRLMHFDKIEKKSFKKIRLCA